MSLRRTPPPKAHASNSDLTDDSSDISNNITDRRQKRKRDEICVDTLSSFMTEVKSMVQDIKDQNNELKSELASIKLSISDFHTELSSIRSDHNKTMTIITEIQERQSSLKTEFNSLADSLEFTSAENKNLSVKMGKIEAKLKDSDHIQTQLHDIQKNVRTIQEDLGQQQQNDRILNLEIAGVPELKNENLCDMFLRIAKHAGVDMSCNNITHITRVQPRQKTTGRPKNIIVKLRNKIDKDNIISGLRKTRGITTEDIQMQGESKRVYVNEHLTVENKQLLKKCRDAVKSKSFEFLWVKNCKIYVRKNDTSEAINIKTESDIRKLH